MNFHVLTQDEKRKSAKVIFHIPIPATTNSAGISWQQAVVKEQGGEDAILSQLPDITAEEQSELTSGALLERQVNVRFSSINLTNAQRLQEIRAAYAATSSEIIAKKQVTLDFMGYEGAVA